MYSSVAELETDVIRRIDAHEWDAALNLIVRFVESVITDSRATATVFGCLPLDRLCQRIGSNVLEAMRIRSPNGPQGRQDLVVFIATELFRSGGHSAIIEDLVKADPERRYLILLTDLYGTCDIDAVANRFGAWNVQVRSAPSGSALDKLRWLLGTLADLAPSKVFLVNNHQDAVAVAAVQAAPKAQVIFVHHGDHNLCLGVYLQGAVHVDPHNLGYFNCRNHLGIAENKYWPLVVEDLGRRPPQVRFLEDGLMRTCSSGHKSKFEAPYLHVYADEVPNLLDTTRGVHLHIGELSEKTLERIYSGLESRRLAKERFVYIPWVESVWRTVIEHRVDLYISSFPLGGGRASIEVMGSGTPMVMHESYLSRFHGGGDLAYPEAYSWKRPAELYAHVKGLTPELLARESAYARRHYERHHTPDRLKQEVAGVNGQSPGLTPLPLRAHEEDPVQTYLDHVRYSNGRRDEASEKMAKEIRELRAMVGAQRDELGRVHSSLGWRIAKRLEAIVNKAFPFTTAGKH